MVYPYCIQCVDQKSGKTGSFTYDPKEGNSKGQFKAVSPVFVDLMELFNWARTNNVVLTHSASNPWRK